MNLRVFCIVVVVVAGLVSLFLFSLSYAAFHVARRRRQQAHHIIVILKTIIEHYLIYLHQFIVYGCPQQPQQQQQHRLHGCACCVLLHMVSVLVVYSVAYANLSFTFDALIINISHNQHTRAWERTTHKYCLFYSNRFCVLCAFRYCCLWSLLLTAEKLQCCTMLMLAQATVVLKMGMLYGTSII